LHHQKIIADLAPIGALEDDVVASIAPSALAQAKPCEKFTGESLLFKGDDLAHTDSNRQPLSALLRRSGGETRGERRI
jgi:hypothetical protein